MCDMTHLYVWHDSFICVTWLIHMCDMTHSFVWHDSFICVTWLIHACLESFICVTWLMLCVCVTWRINVRDILIHICDINHSRAWHDSLSRVTWLIHMCNNILFMCVTGGQSAVHPAKWLINLYGITHSHVWHALLMRVTGGRPAVYPEEGNDYFVYYSRSKYWGSNDDGSVSLAAGTVFICVTWLIRMCGTILSPRDERWGAGVETQKNVRGEVGGWGQVPFNEPYAPSLSTIYDGA